MTRIRSTARLIGALFLSAFLFYGVGSSIAMVPSLVAVGVGMMLVNSVIVIAIGVLVLPVLRAHAAAAASTYLVSRVVEGVLLGGGAVALLFGLAAINELAYNVGMLVLGLGSLFLCAVLYRAALVPRFLAVWGFVGYAVFALGSALELAGVAGAGVVGAIPGGLFELFFGVWLIVRGFRTVGVREGSMVSV